MKFDPPSPLRLTLACGFILLLHATLLEVMARTRIIEKVMALQFNAWELALIALFLGARFAAYFLVPSVVVAFLVSRLFMFRQKPTSK